MVSIKEDEAKEFSKYLDKKNYTQVTKQKIKQMFSEIRKGGENDINLDVADMKCILEHSGQLYIGNIQYRGESSAKIAIELAVNEAKVNNKLLENIMGILVYFSMHPDFAIMEIYDAMNVVNESAHEDADIIFGTITNKALDKKSVTVHILFVADS